MGVAPYPACAPWPLSKVACPAGLLGCWGLARIGRHSVQCAGGSCVRFLASGGVCFSSHGGHQPGAMKGEERRRGQAGVLSGPGSDEGDADAMRRLG
ncbi:hypothetical protein LY76DRAFT_393247 [Colletotrichum caudatum]|nr:hypothetical protein LY76DRAFT_393247 [Colletotrichum caudatum]